MFIHTAEYTHTPIADCVGRHRFLNASAYLSTNYVTGAFRTIGTNLFLYSIFDGNGNHK